jgi:L-lactate dehydrogenase complex protein LldF
VTSLAQPPERFRERAQRTLAHDGALAMIDSGTEHLFQRRLEAWADLADVEALREEARQIRTRTIGELDRHVADFTAALEALGGKVTFCRTADEARDYVVGICRSCGAKLVAKTKSMATEEIGLNGALEDAGVEAVETDVGEYLIQLLGEHPAHIIGPAIEKSAADAAAALSRVDGEALPAEPHVLLQAARRQLRDVFLNADVGVTGVNFGVSQTGSICLVTNEGNGRLITSLPRVHVAVMGMERLVPTLADLAVLLQLLPRSAGGQKLSVYTTLLTGPRRAHEQDGPDELHVVVLDNGRSSLLGGKYEEMLNCIRCGACLNVCPVYRKAGGRAYSDVYSGPMGAVLVPLLAGLERAPALPHASSLCGACTDACPVKIPLHELLLELRRDLVDDGAASRRERLAFLLWSLAWSSPAGYRVSARLARRLAPAVGRLGPGREWTKGRELPRPAPKSFRELR